MPLHKNPGLEIIYIARGEIEWTYAGRTVFTPPNSFVISWPWEEHGIETETVPPCHLYWILVPLVEPYSAPVLEPKIHPLVGLDADLVHAAIRSLKAHGPGRIIASSLSAMLLKEIVAEQNSPGFVHQARARAMVNLLLIELARQCKLAESGRIPWQGNRRVKEFLKALKETCGEEWTLAKMADHCDLGRTRFADLVSTITGDSPLRLLNRLRIEKAQTLLGNPELTITAIAYECGFNSSQYFSRVYREFTGETPGSWRKPSARVKNSQSRLSKAGNKKPAKSRS